MSEYIIKSNDDLHKAIEKIMYEIEVNTNLSETAPFALTLKEYGRNRTEAEIEFDDRCEGMSDALAPIYEYEAATTITARYI
jgi:hypothetical protein